MNYYYYYIFIFNLCIILNCTCQNNLHHPDDPVLLVIIYIYNMYNIPWSFMSSQSESSIPECHEITITNETFDFKKRISKC